MGRVLLFPWGGFQDSTAVATTVATAEAAGDEDLAHAVTLHASRRQRVPERDADAVGAVAAAARAALIGDVVWLAL